MSEEADSIFDLIVDAFAYTGAWLHWLVLLGRKPFSKVRESEIINGIIGFVMMIIVFLLLKDILFGYILDQLKALFKK